MSLNTILATTPLVSTNYILKATGTTIGNSLIWDNGTNVGIGNTNTSYTLDVSGTVRGTTSAYFATTSGSVGIGTITPTSYFYTGNGLAIYNATQNTLSIATDTTGTSSIYFSNGASGAARYNGYLEYIHSTNSMTFGTGGFTKVTIASTGDVLINDVIGNDYAKLQVNATSGTAFALTNTSAAATDSGNIMYFWGTTGYNSMASIGSFWDAASNTNAYLQFKTRGSGVNTERMRITSGGNVNINGSGFSDVKFYVKGSDATSSNYAALFVNGSASNLFNIRNDGAVQVFGSLSKGSGSFRIEHPLESLTSTHQLVHSFIEGPKADLIYRGKLTLLNGKAQANIDEVSTMTEGTFEVLCREVQCFTTNESGWDLVKGKVIGNIIYIESQNTNSTDEISWMVIGERKDKHMMDTDWTDENGKVIVEPLKIIEPTKPTEPTI
jgi:hypothetical protein